MVNYPYEIGAVFLVLLYSIPACFSHDESHLSSAVRQAIRQLLLRHESFPLDPNEESLDVGVRDGFPDPTPYVLPNVIL